MIRPQEIELLVTNSQGRSASVRVKPGSYLVGRGGGCHIRLSPKDRAISRQHARLVVEQRGVRLEDLESNTGTMVNGRIIRSAAIMNQDVISIGSYILKVLIPQDESDPGGPSDHVFSAAAETHAGVSMEALAQDLEHLRRATRRLLEALGRRIVGQEAVLRQVWATILAKGHGLLVGVPGLAKTLMVTTFAETLGLQARRVQFTPDLLPSDITGSNVLHESEGGTRHFEFVQGPVFTQLLLADEINRAPPKTQAALLEAMQERQVTVAGKSLKLPEPFFVIATQNPIEHDGTYPLPEAQQDRFMLSLLLEYPSREEEVEILVKTSAGVIEEVPEILSYRDILRFQEVVNAIAVPSEVAEYSADLVRATRPSGPGSPQWVAKTLEWGAGPRAGQALLRVAKAMAAIGGRPAISRDDVLDAFEPALRHRISLNFRARADGLDESAVLGRIVEEVPWS